MKVYQSIIVKLKIIFMEKLSTIQWISFLKRGKASEFEWFAKFSQSIQIMINKYSINFMDFFFEKFLLFLRGSSNKFWYKAQPKQATFSGNSQSKFLEIL